MSNHNQIRTNKLTIKLIKLINNKKYCKIKKFKNKIKIIKKKKKILQITKIMVKFLNNRKLMNSKIN